MSGYTFVELAQNSSVWLAWRHDGIGGSDAAAVHDASRFKSWRDLLWEKQQAEPPPDDPSEAALRGRRLEPIARAAYIEQNGIFVRPVCIQGAEHPWLRVSLDGMSDDHRTVVEIKCGEGDFAAMLRDGDVPDWHFYQLQHIMAVTGLDVIHVWYFDPDEGGCLFDYERHEPTIEQMIEEYRRFWAAVERGRGLSVGTAR